MQVSDCAAGYWSRGYRDGVSEWLVDVRGLGAHMGTKLVGAQPECGSEILFCTRLLLVPVKGGLGCVVITSDWTRTDREIRRDIHPA